jgi:hypothetical protein
VAAGCVSRSTSAATRMASGSSLASAEEPQVLSEGPPVLLHVPRFCSSIIVAAIAEAGLGQVRVRIVGYPDELRSTELAEQTGGLARVPSLVGVSGAPLLESSAILEYLLETPPLGDGTPIRVGPGDPLRGQYLSLLAFSAATVKPLVSNQVSSPHFVAVACAFASSVGVWRENAFSSLDGASTGCTCRSFLLVSRQSPTPLPSRPQRQSGPSGKQSRPSGRLHTTESKSAAEFLSQMLRIAVTLLYANSFVQGWPVPPAAARRRGVLRCGA